MKKKVLLSSIATIALCLCLIAGSTFALFTSNTGVNIAVTAGEVDVFASLTNLKLYSVTPDDDGEIADENGKLYSYEEQSDKFLNEGTAVINGGTLTLDRVTPGDKVSFNVAVDNNSDVAIAHRFIVSCTDGYSLMYGLNVTINGTTYEHLDTYVSEWESLVAEGSIDDIEIVIELPVTAGNEYQKLSTAINVTVEAVQGNANLDAAPATTYIEKVEDASALQTALDEGKNITALGATITGSDLELNGKDVTLGGMNIVTTQAVEGFTIGFGSGETLTLENGFTLDTSAGYGVIVIGSGTIVLEEGAKISCSAVGSSCIMVQGTLDLYLSESGQLDATIGIYALTSNEAIRIHVPTEELKQEYLAQFSADPGTMPMSIEWIVGGPVAE